MNESIVFSPETDDRALSREVDKIDKSLDKAGQITPEFDDIDLDGLTPDGINGIGGKGGGSGGSGGALEVAGMSSLASKLPKPVAGVSVGAALPVALGGAVGAGMLSAMHSSSAQLQASTSMIEQAWTMFWRPFGNRLDELFIRDIASGLLSTMSEFNERSRKEGLTVGIGWLGSKVEKSWADAVGSNLEGALETFGVDLDVGGKVSNFLQDVRWHKVFTSGNLGGEVGRIMGRHIQDNWPGWPDIKGLWPGWPDWSGLSPGVPDWSVLAPSMPDWTSLNLNLPDWLDKWVNGSAGSTPGNSSPGVDESPSTGSDPSGTGGGGSGPGGGLRRRMARGGVVKGETQATIGESGPEVVQPLSEFERLMERVARSASQNGSGGSGGLSEQDARDIKNGIEDVNRNLKSLARAMSNMSMDVDGETFARMGVNGRQNRMSDVDPLS